LQVLETEIVPRLEAEVPAQVARTECLQSPYMHRFIMVFDREGYSPGFMKRMRDKSIACQTYNKYLGVDWPEEEFQKTRVQLQLISFDFILCLCFSCFYLIILP